MHRISSLILCRNVTKYIKYSRNLTKFEPVLCLNKPKSSKLYNLEYSGKDFDSAVWLRTAHYSSVVSTDAPPVDSITFEKVCEETLESLTDYLESIVEGSNELSSGDVSYSGGVLTVYLGDKYGTYVINRQSPNRQIWLSSPTSGPKRYDFIDNTWIYKHDGVSLHQLLQEEMSKIVKHPVDFTQCSYSNS